MAENTEASSTQQQHEVPEDDRLGFELGVDTNLPFTTPFRPADTGGKYVRGKDGELQEVLNYSLEDDGPSVRDLVAMRRQDGHARALYRLITLPIRASLTNATFLPAEGGEAEAEFIEQLFTTPPESGGMTVTLHKFMAQLLQGLFDGFAAFEKVFWRPDHGPLAGKITLKKLAHRPSDTITFISDEAGGFAGFRQRAYKNGKSVDVYIEPEYAFYFAAQEEERKFYGVSFFQSAFYHYDKKIRLYYTMHLAAQRAAVGTRIGTLPANASKAQKTSFAQQLSNLAVAQWMMIPVDAKVESLKESGDYDYLGAVTHHNHMMSESILAPFFDSDTGGGKNESGALVNFAQPGDEMFLLMLRTIQDDIANQINHYVIPQLIDYNFKGGKYPTFVWGKLTDEQKAGIAATFDKIAQNPQNLTPEFVRAMEEHMAEEFGLDIDYDEVEERENAEREMMLQQEQGIVNDPASGAPLSPEDSQIEQFENAALGLTGPDDATKEAYRELMVLASELLDATE